MEGAIAEVGEGTTYQNDLEQHFLVDLHELLIPLVDVGRLLSVVVLLFGRLDGIVAVLLAPLNNLAEHRLVDVGNGNRLINVVITDILYQVLNEHRALRDNTVLGAYG